MVVNWKKILERLDMLKIMIEIKSTIYVEKEM